MCAHHRKLRLGEIVDGVSEPVRTVVDGARNLLFDVALTVADSALRVGAVQSEEPCTLASGLQGRGAVQSRAVLATADRQAANPLESVLGALWFEARGSRAGFDEDCRRHTALVCSRRLALRFTSKEVMHDLDWVRALTRGLHIAKTRAAG